MTDHSPPCAAESMLAPGPPAASHAITTVLFDLDGTLVDTAPDMGYALNTVLREHGLSPRPLAELRPFTSHGSLGLIRHAFGFGAEHPEFAAIRQRFLEVYNDNLLVDTRLFPETDALLHALERSGIRWGVVTNKPAWLTDPLMKRLGLHTRAACIVSGDTAARPKPEPDPLHHACGLLACNAVECVYVGDAERDIIAGNRAGMTTLVALFGYLHDDDRPETWGAAGMIATPLGVLEWLGIDV